MAAMTADMYLKKLSGRVGDWVGACRWFLAANAGRQARLEAKAT
jgi:hypothetical protein